MKSSWTPEKCCSTCTRDLDRHTTVPSDVLFGVYEAKRKTSRPSLVYCGDDESGKKCGRRAWSATWLSIQWTLALLRIGRYIEPFALLSAQLAYDGNGEINSWVRRNVLSHPQRPQHAFHFPSCITFLPFLAIAVKRDFVSGFCSSPR